MIILIILMILIQDDVTGVDPSVFRRYFREEEEEVSDDNHNDYHDYDHDEDEDDEEKNFTEVNDNDWLVNSSFLS